MTAKDAADHIAATPLEDLEGFVSEGEERAGKQKKKRSYPLS